jgi:hypothetical protein
VSCGPAHQGGGGPDGGLAVAGHGMQPGFLLAVAAGGCAVHPSGEAPGRGTAGEVDGIRNSGYTGGMLDRRLQRENR